jgi:hypothetical protein
MSNQRTPSRFCILSLVATVVGGALFASPSAAAADSEAYTRIVPRAPRSELSAAVLSGLCSGIATKTIAGCAALDAAKAFCASPLTMTLPRPSMSELNTLLNATACPVSAMALAPLNAGVKAATSFDLGWQDALIHGLANFLVNRAKAEALAAAADRFQRGVCGDPTGARMMPMTCALLGTSDPYKVPVSWVAVNATVQKDLHELPLRALELGVPLRTKDLLDAPELLYAAVDIGERNIAENQESVPLLVGLQDKYATAAGHCADRPMGCGLLGTGIASEVLLNGYSQTAAANTNFAPIAIRVIVDQATSVGLVPAGAAAAASLAANLHAQFGRILAAIDSTLAKGLAAKQAKKPEDITAYASALTSIPTAMTGAFAASVGLTAHQLTPPTDAIAIWTQLLSAALNKDYVNASVQVILLLKTIEGGDLPPWTQYLPMLAQLAQADTADKVQNVVEQLAAPVGSYRGKRGAGNRMLSINGYLGAQGGPEWLGGGGIPKARSFQAGVFAPIGFESSWGFGKSSSLGVLLSVIDLGAVVSFRTSSDTTIHGAGTDTVTVAQSPQVGLSQVFSPGLYVVYGIPCTPLALGVGGSLSPELRSVTFTSTGAEEQTSAFRVSAFLAVDVTIFPF